jgi:hypothetical protein
LQWEFREVLGVKTPKAIKNKHPDEILMEICCEIAEFIVEMKILWWKHWLRSLKHW